MNLTRIIPCLLLKGRGLVKTTKFKSPTYVGDPTNAVRIFNEREVDELILLDITATLENRKPHFELIQEIVSESFVPLAYGGGIRNLDDARTIFGLGVEKIVVNSSIVADPLFVRRAAETFGSQSVVACIDVRKKLLGGYEVCAQSARKGTGLDPTMFARRMEELGAGELVVQSIDRDGTMSGYDLTLIKAVTDSVTVPVIAMGGAGRIDDFAAAIMQGGASAAAAGSLFVFHGPHRAVLISYPDRDALDRIFSSPA